MAFRIFRRLQELLDVDDAGLGDGDVPTYATAASKFTMAPAGAALGHSVTLGGNTAGALALISTGTWTLAGGANVTLSQAGNAVTISGAAGGGAETQTAISGVSASNTLYTSGTVRITGVGGGITVSSNTGQRIDLSVAAPVAQSVQTQNLIDLTLNGNTAGALALVSSGTFTLAGGANVTLSQAGNAVTISGAAQSVQPETQTFLGGVSASDTLYTSGTVRLTGVGGGVTVSSNTGQRVDISVAAPVAQSVQTQNVVDLTLSGNTAGALALISSGTMTLAGGNNITLSQAGNALTISGPNVGGAQTGISGLANSQTTYTAGSVTLSELGAITIRSTTGNHFQFSVNAQSVQPETQTFIAGVSASDTLYTSGNVRITGVGGGVTVSSNTGQRIDISVAAQSVQAETQTFIAGVSASNTLYTSGNVRISGSQAVTVRSGTGQLVVIDVPAQSVQAETQTFLAGAAASNTTYTSGTFTITGVGGGITVSSNTGQRIDLSVAAPVAQTNQAGNVYASSNTFGTSSGTYDARSLSIAGRGAVSVAASNSGWIISAPAQSVQAETQTFIAGISASDTLYTSGNVRFTGLGAITVGSNTGQRVDLSVAAQTVQTQGVPLVGVSTGGNTAGDTTVNSGTRLVFVGSNNITLSQGTAANATTITISGPSVAGAQTGISGIANSQTTYTSGTVSLSELGAITIRSTTGNQYQLSVNAQTNQAGSVYAISNTTGTSSGTYDARTLSIAGAGIVTVAASNSGWRIDATTAAQTNQAGNVYASSNTFGTSSGTYDARSISIAGRGAVSVAASNSGWIISAPAQSVQAETQTFIGGLSNSNTTYTSGTVGLSELGAITIRSTTGNQFQFSVNSQTVQTQNLHNVTLSGNTAGAMAHISSGTMTLAGGNGITLSQAGNAVTISGGAGGAGFSAGVSTGGNTAGATGISGTQLVLVGTNNISLSQTTGANGATISINNTVSAFQAGMSTEGNTAGNTGVTGTRLVLVGTGPISLSQTTGANGATVSINAPATSSLSASNNITISSVGSTIKFSVPDVTIGDWQNFPLALAALMTHVSGISKTPFYWNDELIGKITAKSLVFRLSNVATGTLQSFSAHLGIYTLVNSTSAALVGSLSESYVLSTASSASWSGVRNFVMTGIGTHAGISTLSAGDYVFGMMFSAGATGSMHQSLYGAGVAGGPLGRIIPGVNQASTGTSQGAQPLYGRGSTTVNVMPANIVASEIVNQGQGASMQLHPWIYIRS